MGDRSFTLVGYGLSAHKRRSIRSHYTGLGRLDFAYPLNERPCQHPLNLLDFFAARTMLAALHQKMTPMANADQPPSLLELTDEKLLVTSLLRLRAPLGGQEIELQELNYIHGGASLLRTRIREGRRFTVFDLDAVTARDWAKAMGEWAESQLQKDRLGNGS